MRAFWAWLGFPEVLRPWRSCRALFVPCLWASHCLQCYGCEGSVHPTCLGLGPCWVVPVCWFCPVVHMPGACLEQAGSASDEAVASAHNLVWLRGRHTQDSSQATYTSALHRFVHFGTTVLGLPPVRVLPPGLGLLPSFAAVEHFISWGMSRYKLSTLRVTLNALADWCSSKGSPPTPVRTTAVEQLLKSVAIAQGPVGLPRGKLGMSKEVLQLLFSRIGELKREDPRMSDILTRDSAWLALGFFGFLRRSELIALRMGDVELSSASS